MRRATYALQLAELHAAASEPRQVAAQDREPCVEKRVIYVVETITPSRVEEIGRILSRSRRPDPDIRIEKKPVLAVDPSYRDAGCFSPMDSLRVRMIFIDRCEEAGNLARDFAHYVLQSGEWRLVRVVRVGDKIRAGFGGTGSSFSPRSRLCRIAARKSRDQCATRRMLLRAASAARDATPLQTLPAPLRRLELRRVDAG